MPACLPALPAFSNKIKSWECFFPFIRETLKRERRGPTKPLYKADVVQFDRLS